MKALVTGGAGFIGSHLVEALLRRGDEVWVLDDLSTGSLDNLAGIKDEGRLHFFQGSVLDAELVQDLVDRAEFVYHLAAAVGVKYVLDHPLNSLLTNIRGSENVLESAHRAGGKPVVLYSSSEVYGKGTRVPFVEDQDRLLGPTQVLRWSYAIGKAVDEYLAMGYHQERGLPVVVVRCFNTCGPRQSGAYGMVLPRFVQQALRDEPIQVYGDGSQTRCFAHVADVVSGTLLLAKEPRAFGEVFNVGTEEEISVLDLAKAVKKAAGSRSPIEFVPFERVYGSNFEDMDRRVPSLEKIRALVGYEPRVSFEELLRSTIESHRPQAHPGPRAAAATPAFVRQV
jgi:UDP-glucose 4-epimerase